MFAFHLYEAHVKQTWSYLQIHNMDIADKDSNAGSPAYILISHTYWMVALSQLTRG